ncbi:MAG: hypothetical protein AAFY65_18655 [Pseudomonadota bacterium]
MTPRIETVFRDEEMTLRWLPGSSKRMVVVFTGMYHAFGGEGPDEFAASASIKGANNVLFVSDRRSTWFAAPGLWRRMVKMIRYIRRSEGMQEVISLGNSMGGYGAMLLPKDLRVTRAIAFAPQVTMDRSLLQDDRWPDVQKRWGVLPVRNVGETFAQTRTQYHVVVGGGCAEDVAHLDLLPAHKRLHTYVLPGGRHNLARGLKEAGVLGDVIEAILKGRRARVERLFGAYQRAAA